MARIHVRIEQDGTETASCLACGTSPINPQSPCQSCGVSFNVAVYSREGSKTAYIKVDPKKRVGPFTLREEFRLATIAIWGTQEATFRQGGTSNEYIAVKKHEFFVRRGFTHADY